MTERANIMEAVARVYEVLKPLDSDERLRALEAVQVLLDIQRPTRHVTARQGLGL